MQQTQRGANTVPNQDAVLAGEIMKQRALIYGVIFGLGAWAGIVAFIFCLVEFFAV